jgi:hypothetical protein
MRIIEFPIAERSITESEIDKLHSEAFRDLEEEVADLERMGAIADMLVIEWALDKDNVRCMELASFASNHLADMLRAFQDGYHARWHGEKRGQS